MKKIKKIMVLLVVFLFGFYNICFADIIFGNEVPQYHGNYEAMMRESSIEDIPTKIPYILIGIFILLIVVCTAIIIRRIIKKKKDKTDDNK